MSENVELMRQAYTAFANGGAEAALPFFDGAIEIEESREFPDTGTYRGHAGLLQVISLYTDTFDDFRMEPEEFIDGTENSVIVAIRLSGTAKASRMATEIRSYHVHMIKHRKSVHLRVLLDRAEALEAAGLSE